MKEIPLTQGKVALVDDEDFERLMAMGKWQFGGRYAQKTTHIGRLNNKQITTTLLMHRAVAECPNDKEVDHIDGNKLNNQKNNLRVCSRLENGKNRLVNKNSSTGFKGVTICPSTKLFRADIMCGGKSHFLGRFHKVQDAVIAYNAASIAHHGEFSKLNPL